jgi:hypothetical protein
MKPSPGPWKWREVNGAKTVEAWCLQCADDTYVAIPNTDETISLRSEDDKALIALAPEMREMLIGLERTPGAYDGEMGGEPGCPVCRYPMPVPGDPHSHAVACALAALLDRIR